MNITLHLSGIGHRRFCGADAAEQAERWAHHARRRIEAPSDDEAESAAAEKLARITSTRTARAILAELKRYSRANTLELCAAVGVTSSAAARILLAFAKQGDVIDHGQKDRRTAKEWEAV